MSKLFSKADFKRMRCPVHVILVALSMFYLGKNSFSNIALILCIVSDHYFVCQMTAKMLHGIQHIRVDSFQDDITNNFISMFIFFYNFVCLHFALNGLTSAQCAGLHLSQKRKCELMIVA